MQGKTMVEAIRGAHRARGPEEAHEQFLQRNAA